MKSREFIMFCPFNLSNCQWTLFPRIFLVIFATLNIYWCMLINNFLFLFVVFMWPTHFFFTQFHILNLHLKVFKKWFFPTVSVLLSSHKSFWKDWWIRLNLNTFCILIINHFHCFKILWRNFPLFFFYFAY